MRPHELSTVAVIALAVLSACSSKPTEGEPLKPVSAKPEPPWAYTLIVSYGIPVGTKIFFDKKPVSEIVADGEYHVVRLELPRDVDIDDTKDRVTARPPSPCGDVDIKLVARKKKPDDKPPKYDPAWISFQLEEGAWDKARVYVQRPAKDTTKVRIGKLELADGPPGEGREMFGFTCPEARKIFFNDKEVGTLPEPLKDQTTNYLVSIDKQQRYCMNEVNYGIGINMNPKHEAYAGQNVYKLMGEVAFWMKPPAERIEEKGELGATFVKYALETGGCKP